MVMNGYFGIVMYFQLERVIMCGYSEQHNITLIIAYPRCQNITFNKIETNVTWKINLQLARVHEWMA